MSFLSETFPPFLPQGYVLCLRLNLEEIEMLLKILTFNLQWKGVNAGRVSSTSSLCKV